MSAAGTTTNVAQAFVQMLFFVDQPRAVFAYFSDRSSKHNATDVSLAEVPLWSHEPLNSCRYTFLILYSMVNAEGHVTRQLCDRNRIRGSLCLQHCFSYDVTPDVGLYSRGRHGAKKGVDQTRDRKMLIGSSLLLHR